MTQMVRAMVLGPMEEPMVEARRALEVLAPYERAPLELAPSEESEWRERAPSEEFPDIMEPRLSPSMPAVAPFR